MTMNNPIEIGGIEFVEFASHDPEALHRMFLEFGFSRVMRHAERPIDLYVQGEIHFLFNCDLCLFVAGFEKTHSPYITTIN